ncbi:SAM-dependent methyltransferase [Streptomyces sp. NPDC046203]|uniref:SAM-dependent methyltransferase n=1 Tax=Streptomyces sp. NPDC046203 TaxID=3154602 RepID=UPI0033DD877B
MTTTSLNPVERTALLTAALRSAETLREDRLYSDPYAERLVGDIGPKLLAEVRAATFPADRPRSLPSTPDYNAIRTRFFDDYLQRAAADRQMTQIVLAPAGMDSRAYRLPWPEHIRYFEVDRPAVLAFKSERLDGVSPRVDHRTVAVDLTAADWEQRLIAAGYDPSLPSTWLLEGLLYYIPGADTHRMLDRVAALMAPGSRIAADIVNSAALTLPHMRGLLDVFEGWGCPWVYGDDEPEQLFAGHGFDVRAVQPGEPEADFGRWPDAVPDREIKDVRRVFFVTGRRATGAGRS